MKRLYSSSCLLYSLLCCLQCLELSLASEHTLASKEASRASGEEHCQIVGDGTQCLPDLVSDADGHLTLSRSPANTTVSRSTTNSKSPAPLLDPDEIDIEDDEFEEHELTDFQIPEGYNLQDAVRNLSNSGSGFYLMKGMYSKKDMERALNRVARYKVDPSGRKNFNSSEFLENADDHNNFSGLLFGLINRGRIFEKLSQHPVVLEISREMLGETAQISSLGSNTVLPGMPAQNPHLDYPYYDFLFPNRSDAMHTKDLLALQFVILLTDFTLENGGTAIRPYSHAKPQFPTDQEEFHRNAIQVVAEAGDIIAFAGPIQHCAMENRSNKIRSGILLHFAPSYIRPFESIWVRPEVEARASPDLRKILGLDHPYPAIKQKRKKVD